MKKNRMMTLCGTLLALTIGLTGCGSKEETTENVVVATVNEQELYKSDYDALYNDYLNYFGGGDEAKEYLNSQKTVLLSELTTTELLFQKAEELGFEATQEEVDKAYNDIKEQYGEETVKQMLEQSGLTEEAYKETIREQILLGKLQEVMIEGDTAVAEDEIEKYYNDNIDKYTVGAGANMKHILVQVAPDADEDAIKKADEAVKKIQQELESGKSFDELYTAYSTNDSEQPAYITEDLGYVAYDQPNFDKDFLAGVKDVKEGQVSAPIKSSFGYHFVEVKGISDETVTPLAEVKDVIRQTLVEEKEYSLYTACLEKWISEANIVTYEDRI